MGIVEAQEIRVLKGKQMLNRPKITDEILSQIRETIEEHPSWGRKRISIHLCELWDWRVPGGQVKDISCRDMLRALDKAGAIKLPEPQRASGTRHWRKTTHIQHKAEPIACELNALRPLQIDIAERGGMLAEFKSLIDQYHYLGYDRAVGENMKYIIRSRAGATLACVLFGSAAWKCRDRDAFIGWNREQRTAGLSMMTNNTRFLIMPSVNVPHLASHALALISRRISGDWKKKYGHGLVALETFVEVGRFRGTCYKAANWICVGRTAGRGRNDRQHEQALAEKDIYLLPLTRRWRQSLLSGWRGLDETNMK
jgi:hypothetical protein